VGLLLAQPRQGRGAQGAGALSSLSLARKLPEGPEVGRSETSNPLFKAAPFGQRLFCAAASCCAEEAVALCLNMSETFCGLLAPTDTQKVFGASMDSLADTLRHTPKWLKSSSTHSGE
jgi:hypothetical protein